jgi:membrane fusion protein
VTAHDPIPLFRPEATQARKQRVHGEIVLGQPVGTRTLVVLLAAIIASLMAWLLLGEYTRTETVRGILVTDSTSAKIVAVRPGLVTRMLVREGDRVRPGQLLVAIQVEPGRESGGSAIADGLAAVATQQRLAEDQVRIAGQRASSERARLNATLSGLARERADVAAQIQLQQQIVDSAQETFNRIGALVDKGFVSGVEYERRRQAALSAKQQLSHLQQQSNALSADERRAAAELTRVNADAAGAAASARSASAGLAQQQAHLAAERSYAIVAPIGGRVTAVQAAAGETVDPSVPLMVIIPDGAALHAEVYAPTRAIGFVKPGQETRLLYDAFPYQRFGSFKARVTGVSRTVIDPRELGTPLKIEEPVYRIEVALERQAVDAFGEAYPLQPGMTLSANIVLDRQSFLEWLLQPLNAVLRRTA